MCRCQPSWRAAASSSGSGRSAMVVGPGALRHRGAYLIEIGTPGGHQHRDARAAAGREQTVVADQRAGHLEVGRVEGRDEVDRTLVPYGGEAVHADLSTVCEQLSVGIGAEFKSA